MKKIFYLLLIFVFSLAIFNVASAGTLGPGPFNSGGQLIAGWTNMGGGWYYSGSYYSNDSGTIQAYTSNEFGALLNASQTPVPTTGGTTTTTTGDPSISSNYKQGLRVLSLYDMTYQPVNPYQYATLAAAQSMATYLGGTVGELYLDGVHFKVVDENGNVYPQYVIRVGNYEGNAGAILRTYELNSKQVADQMIQNEIKAANQTTTGTTTGGTTTGTTGGTTTTTGTGTTGGTTTGPITNATAAQINAQMVNYIKQLISQYTSQLADIKTQLAQTTTTVNGNTTLTSGTTSTSAVVGDPTVDITFSDGLKNKTVAVGDTLIYKINMSNIDSVDSFYNTVPSDTCVGGSTNGEQKPWIAKAIAPISVFSDTVKSCQAGATYVITVVGTNKSSNKISASSISVIVK